MARAIWVRKSRSFADEAMEDREFRAQMTGDGLTVDDFSSPGRMVQLGYPPNRVDLMTAIDGVDFESAWSSRAAGRYGAAEVFYIGKDELIRNKSAAGRPQDQMDLSLLTEPR